jgi:hypothetical protein
MLMAMTPEHMKLIRQACRSTGMFCLHHDVIELAAFLSGYGGGIAHASGNDPFEGFNEWFSARMGWDRNVWWLSIADDLMNRDPRQATFDLLALIEECVADLSKSAIPLRER